MESQVATVARNILDLPEELLLTILLYLKGHLRELFSLARTCRKFHRIIHGHRPNDQISILIQDAEQLRNIRLFKFIAEGNSQRRLFLNFTIRLRENQQIKMIPWHDSISRNVEEALPNLTSVYIAWCSIDVSRVRTLPRTLKTLKFFNCRIVERIPATSTFFGLPYLTAKCEMFELLLSDWIDIGWRRVSFYSCFDQFMNPYGIRIWLYLNHNLEGDTPWTIEHPNFHGSRYLRRAIRGWETYIRHLTEESSLNKYNVEITRSSSSRSLFRSLFVEFKAPCGGEVEFWTRWRKDGVNFTFIHFKLSCLLTMGLVIIWLAYLVCTHSTDSQKVLDVLFWILWSGLCLHLAFGLAWFLRFLQVSSVEFDNLTRTYQLGPSFCRRSLSHLWLVRLTKITSLVLLSLFLIQILGLIIFKIYGS